MKKFTIKLLLFLSPILLLLSIYLYQDPFKVLYHYDAYYAPSDTSYVGLNNDYVATQTLVQNYPQQKYDSYIFGSSRSGNYWVSEWARHINSSRDYHFGANYESLYGIEKKLQFLAKNKYPVNNALIIIDRELLSDITNPSAHLFIKHPSVSGESRVVFQFQFLKAYFDKDFLIAYLHLISTHQRYAYAIAHKEVEPQVFHYDVSSNEISAPQTADSETDSEKYYRDRAGIFYTRDTALHYTKAVIGHEQNRLLHSIKDQLTAAHTNYRIVISPLYDQVKMDTTDVKTLKNIFGPDLVFDFSGINDFTQNKYNYFETSHYRPRVATAIMNIIYK